MGMADRYDARLAVRPPSDRKFSEPDQKDRGGSDPLTELARAAAGRGLTGAAGRARIAGNAAPAQTQQQPNMLGDLEAEMMGNLHASFTVVTGGAEASPAPVESEADP